MNIGIFSDTYSPQINGVITSFVTLKKELEKRGHNVTIVTVKTPLARENEPGVIRLPSIPFRAFDGMRIGVFYPPQYVSQIRDLKLDIIHTQTEFTVGAFGRMMGKYLHIPVVHTYHTMYEDYVHYMAKTELNKKILKKLTKKGMGFYMNTCAGIIVPTEKTRESIESYGVTKPISVIPTGVELESFGGEEEDQEALRARLKEIRSWLGIRKDDRVLLSLGRVAKEKSIDIIISQIADYLRSHKNVKLLIVGDGPEKANLEQLAARLHLEKSVIFTGWVEHSHAKYYYKLADAFVTASVTETQGLTLYEAMAADTVVIAKYDKNLEGALADGVNSLIFREDDQLKEKVQMVFEDEALKKSLRAAGQETVKNLSAQRFGERVEEVYGKAMVDFQEQLRQEALLEQQGGGKKKKMKKMKSLWKKAKKKLSTEKREKKERKEAKEKNKEKQRDESRETGKKKSGKGQDKKEKQEKNEKKAADA